MTTGYRIGEFHDTADEIKRLNAQAGVVGALEDAAFRELGVPEAGLGLDVGCGPGFVAQRLRASRPSLALWGVDLDRQALKLTPKDMPTVRADAHYLPFPSQRFDFALTRLMLRHIPDPASALEEMLRVVRPGGLVVIEDCDDGSMVVDPYPANFERTLAARHASLRRRGAEPLLARRLPGMMRAAGLTSVEVRPITVTSEEIGVEAFMKVVMLPVAEAIDPDLLDPEEVRAARGAITEWGRSTHAFGMTTLLTMRGVRA